MGFMDYFFEKTEDQPKSTPGSTPIVPSVNQAVPVIGAETNIPAVAGIKSDDLSKFRAHFDELFDKANLPGPDYYEFRKMCEAMASLPENLRYQTAFSGLQVQGLTKEKLLSTVQHYIDIIDEDAKKFNVAIDEKIMAEVKRLRADAEVKKQDVARKAEMIQSLQNEILADKQAIDTLTTDANEQERKASEKSITYKSACDTIKSGLSEDITKINTYVK